MVIQDNCNVFDEIARMTTNLVTKNGREGLIDAIARVFHRERRDVSQVAIFTSTPKSMTST
jgi:hypothetical protein